MQVFVCPFWRRCRPFGVLSKCPNGMLMPILPARQPALQSSRVSLSTFIKFTIRRLLGIHIASFSSDSNEVLFAMCVASRETANRHTLETLGLKASFRANIVVSCQLRPHRRTHTLVRFVYSELATVCTSCANDATRFGHICTV